MTKRDRLPRQRVPTHPQRDWLLRVIDLLEWICDRCSQDTGYILEPHGTTSKQLLQQLGDALTAVIESHNGQLVTSYPMRYAAEEVSRETGYSPGLLLQRLRDDIRSAILGAHDCKLAPDIVEAARTAVPILRGYARASLPDAVKELRPATPAAEGDWVPPSGFVGSKTIGLDPRFQKHGKNPPRTTIDAWLANARKKGEAPQVIYAPDSNELHLPESWVRAQINRWFPRKPNKNRT